MPICKATAAQEKLLTVKMQQNQRKSVKAKRRLFSRKNFAFGEYFYFDLDCALDKLEQNIINLGGKVEQFLCQEVTVIVTNKFEVSALNKCRDGDGFVIAERISDVNGSFSVNSGSAISRSQQLLHKSQPTQQLGGLLGIAARWKIRICHLVEVQRALSRTTQSKECVAVTPRITRIPEPNIKIEDESKEYKPIVQVFQSFPAVNVECSPWQCPFTRASNAPSEARRKTKGELKAPPQTLQVATKSEKTIPASSIVGVDKRHMSGYCESCNQLYTSLPKHLQSSQHVTFAKCFKNFSQLDIAISQLPSLENLVTNCSDSSTSQKQRKATSFNGESGMGKEKIDGNHQDDIMVSRTATEYSGWCNGMKQKDKPGYTQGKSHITTSVFSDPFLQQAGDRLEREVLLHHDWPGINLFYTLPHGLARGCKMCPGRQTNIINDFQPTTWSNLHDAPHCSTVHSFISSGISTPSIQYDKSCFSIHKPKHKSKKVSSPEEFPSHNCIPFLEDVVSHVDTFSPEDVSLISPSKRKKNNSGEATPVNFEKELLQVEPLNVAAPTQPLVDVQESSDLESSSKNKIDMNDPGSTELIVPDKSSGRSKNKKLAAARVERPRRTKRFTSEEFDNELLKAINASLAENYAEKKDLAVSQDNCEKELFTKKIKKKPVKPKVVNGKEFEKEESESDQPTSRSSRRTVSKQSYKELEEDVWELALELDWSEKEKLGKAEFSETTNLSSSNEMKANEERRRRRRERRVATDDPLSVSLNLKNDHLNSLTSCEEVAVEGINQADKKNVVSNVRKVESELTEMKEINESAQASEGNNAIENGKVEIDVKARNKMIETIGDESATAVSECNVQRISCDEIKSNYQSRMGSRKNNVQCKGNLVPQAPSAVVTRRRSRRLLFDSCANDSDTFDSKNDADLTVTVSQSLPPSSQTEQPLSCSKDSQFFSLLALESSKKMLENIEGQFAEHMFSQDSSGCLSPVHDIVDYTNKLRTLDHISPQYIEESEQHHSEEVSRPPIICQIPSRLFSPGSSIPPIIVSPITSPHEPSVVSPHQQQPPSPNKSHPEHHFAISSFRDLSASYNNLSITKENLKEATQHHVLSRFSHDSTPSELSGSEDATVQLKFKIFREGMRQSPRFYMQKLQLQHQYDILNEMKSKSMDSVTCNASMPSPTCGATASPHDPGSPCASALVAKDNTTVPENPRPQKDPECAKTSMEVVPVTPEKPQSETTPPDKQIWSISENVGLKLKLFNPKRKEQREKRHSRKCLEKNGDDEENLIHTPEVKAYCHIRRSSVKNLSLKSPLKKMPHNPLELCQDRCSDVAAKDMNSTLSQPSAKESGKWFVKQEGQCKLRIKLNH